MKIFFVNIDVNIFLKTRLFSQGVYVEQGNIIIVLRSFIKNM